MDEESAEEFGRGAADAAEAGVLAVVGGDAGEEVGAHWGGFGYVSFFQFIEAAFLFQLNKK